jgi:hypothetical protein
MVVAIPFESVHLFIVGIRCHIFFHDLGNLIKNLFSITSAEYLDAITPRDS